VLTAELSSAPAPVCSRRIGAGVRPPPGATSRRPAWWGAADWIEVEVRGAVAARRDLCRAHHVDPDTVVAVARGMAGFADFRTGRNCRPTNARLVALLRVSLSTVQRARRVLKDLGLVVELLAGRSMMTRAERLTAWRRGSAHRRLAAEFALCSRRHLTRTGRRLWTVTPHLPLLQKDLLFRGAG
jgi:DNA-binding transcriptional ArsR family regulator